MTRLLTAVLALAMTGCASSSDGIAPSMTGSGWGQAPPEIQALNDLPNAADLYLVYCSPFNIVCVTRRDICYGQCGNQESADATGYACVGDIEGDVPPGFHYARWFSIDYHSGKRIGGLATKGYDTKDCHNRR